MRNRVDVKLVNNGKSYLKWASKLSFITQKRFEPVYVRMCILEWSKVPIYEFHFHYIKAKYGSKSKLLFTDADSFMYKIQTENAYDNFSKNKDMFDFSNYSAKSK